MDDVTNGTMSDKDAYWLAIEKIRFLAMHGDTGKVRQQVIAVIHDLDRISPTPCSQPAKGPAHEWGGGHCG